MDHAIQEETTPRYSSPAHYKLFQSAASYNNAACKQMDDQNYERAIKLYTKAVCFAKKASSLLQNNRHANNPNINKKVGSIDDFMKQFVVSTPVATSGFSASEKHNNGQEDEISIYNHSIEVPTFSTKIGSSDDESSLEFLETFQERLPTILSFNLALAYHLFGIQQKKISYLQKAVAMYEYCFRVEKVRCNNLFVSPLLLAAILSNIGQIKERDGDRAKAAAYFQKLFTMLTYLVQVKRIKRCDFSSFFANGAMGLSWMSNCCCASAA